MKSGGNKDGKVYMEMRGKNSTAYGGGQRQHDLLGPTTGIWKRGGTRVVCLIWEMGPRIMQCNKRQWSKFM